MNTKAKSVVALFLCAATGVSLMSGCFSRGGEEPPPEHTHSYGEWITQNEPSCILDGSKYRKCEGCGNIERQIIEAIGHNSDIWLFDDNSHYKKCVVCDENFQEENHNIKDGKCTVCEFEEVKLATVLYQLNENGDGYVVAGAEGEIVEIPEIYEGLPVTEIAASAFSASEISTVKIADSVTKIGSKAFSMCKKLKKIEISSSVTEVGTYVCWGSGVEEVFIDGNLSKGAFRECENLKSVSFGSNITSLPEQAFYLCPSLKEITLPKQINSCGQYAFRESGLEKVKLCGDLLGSVPLDTMYIFYGCKNLVEATFAPTAAKLSYYAFDTCSSLERYIVEDGHPNFTSYNGIIYSKDMQTCVKAGHGIKGEVEIPDGVLSLSGEQPFRNCKNLTSVILPASLTQINNACFSGSGIKSINIPDGVTKISAKAFSECEALQNVHLGAGVTEIEEGAFSGINLTNLTISPQNEKFTALNNCIVTGYGTQTCTLIVSNAENEIPSGVTEIADYAFSNKNFTTFVVPEGIKKISRGMFEWCEKLESITLPSTLTEIDRYAFRGCSSLKNLTIPSNVKFINVSAFEKCTGLTSVTFENKTGWTAKKNNSTDAALTLNLDDSAANAKFLSETYYKYNWKIS